MPNFGHCAIEFDFEFGTIKNKHMMVEIQTETESISVNPDESSKGFAKIEVDLPTCVVLKFTGKDYNTDTIVDENGKIIQDVYVKISNMRLDGFVLNEKFMHQKIKISTDQGQEFTTSYIGFNGTVQIVLSEKDVFSQYLSMNL